MVYQSKKADRFKHEFAARAKQFGESDPLLTPFINEMVEHITRTGASDWATADGSLGVARRRSSVVVADKTNAEKVLLNEASLYSVSGYNERAAQWFGKIYLGLDAGRDYWQQSKSANDAIGKIADSVAFARALSDTRNVLASSPNWTVDKVSQRVLANLSNYWFDLPDERHVFFGWKPNIFSSRPLCPIDFAILSGGIFKPDPGFFLLFAADVVGQKLSRAVSQYVQALRNAGRQPRGVLSRAIFDAFPTDNHLVARTIIGVMMGMLPTVNYNLVNTVSAWRSSGDFEKLKRILAQDPDKNAFRRARRVLEIPLKRAMQRNPVPDAVWRTALRRHTLGGVPINKGAQVKIDIATITQTDAHAGVVDDYPIFGGNRSAARHPLHACPAHNIAIGVLLGMVNGFLEP
jgi:hypothetical protein